jgi:formamidopyrimidine-DNA glycosylase
MPELPEVEVTRQSIGGIEGARVLTLLLGKPLRWPLGVAPEAIAGLRVGPVGRRGKYLWLPLLHDPGAPDGAAAGGLLWHLGMSGSLAFGSGLGPPAKHDHAELVTDRGALRLTDPRRFGAVVWSPRSTSCPRASCWPGSAPSPSTRPGRPRRCTRPSNRVEPR